MTVILVGIPVTLLAASAVSWLQIGIDLPIADDWRVYLERSAQSLDPGYLFRPQNDTLYPVGKFLDVVAHFAFGGNAVVYQLLSMILVLGSLLVLQWILLKLAFRDAFYAAIAFSACAMMFITDSYWGGPSMAYHQALPLVPILAALVVALRASDSFRWGHVAGFVLGLLAGMTYVSGAFGAMVAGGTMVLVSFMGRPRTRPGVSRVGAGLAVAGLVTVLIQLWAVRALQTENSMAGNPLTFPWEADFWFYIAGKVGASLGLPVTRPRVALALTAFAVAAAVVAVVWSLRAVRRQPAVPPRADVVSIVMLTLGATILVYLMLVAAGRSSLRPSAGPAGPIEVFQFGFFRFHFFWVTLIWPWVGAALLSIALGWKRLRSAVLRPASLGVSLMVPLLAIGLATATGAFDFSSFYRIWATARMETYRCLLESVQRNDGYECVIWDRMDPVGLIAYARSVNASFVRYLQTVPLGPPVEPLFSLRDPASGSIEYVDASVTVDEGSSLTIQAGNDAQMIIAVSDRDSMERCRTLEIRAALHSSQVDVAQAFYLRPDDSQFAPDRVATVPVSPDGAQETSLMLSSDAGFADTVRFDPVFSPQQVELDGLEIYCRVTSE